MKITLEFDDDLKPVMAQLLAPAFDKMHKPKDVIIPRKEYLAAFTMLTKLEFELGGVFQSGNDVVISQENIV